MPGIVVCGLNGCGKSTLGCPVLRVDGTRPVEETVDLLAERIGRTP